MNRISFDTTIELDVKVYVSYSNGDKGDLHHPPTSTEVDVVSVLAPVKCSPCNGSGTHDITKFIDEHQYELLIDAAMEKVKERDLEHG